ncbi:MAG: hypothetical protein CL486_04535, partial [Acidobacteria bacterium]|nr:hypothetical protein [Acidobacteriota bacterium]
MINPIVKHAFVIVVGIAACSLLFHAEPLLGGQAISQDVAPHLTHLRKVLPDADTFTREASVYPYFHAYQEHPTDGTVLVGLAFFSEEVGAGVTGYSGPINMMVGLDLTGSLRGVTVIDHQEPYGPRSIEQPIFQRQFIGKHVRQMFHVGTDIDTVSGATITVRAAT